MVTTTIEIDHIEELSATLLRQIKRLAKGKRTKITIQFEEEDYLTEHPQMKAILDQRIQHIEAGENLLTFDNTEELLKKIANS